MFTIETSRMVGRSDMIVEDGLLKGAQQPDGILDIFSLKPSTGRESAFWFYDKENPDAKICHVGITWQRGRTEVSYGTETPYRRKGFMQEALVAFLEWFSTNTSENILWDSQAVMNPRIFWRNAGLSITVRLKRIILVAGMFTKYTVSK